MKVFCCVEIIDESIETTLLDLVKNYLLAVNSFISLNDAKTLEECEKILKLEFNPYCLQTDLFSNLIREIINTLYEQTISSDRVKFVKNLLNFLNHFLWILTLFWNFKITPQVIYSLKKIVKNFMMNVNKI
ncbi:MAG: hypothetical protein EOM50_08770 [Erysipelotrichia bacterium]|nr:hypothetical protein [Erysipelotrichia bacterium]